jgi:hypothetical protein
MSRARWAALDAALVVVFAALGRASHAEANPVLGALSTAWPFLVGLGLGWALVRWRSGHWPISVGNGIGVWLITLVGGMLLRAVTGQGTAPSFVLVAAAVLAAFLLGWRWLAARRALRSSGDSPSPVP